jgi:hypothetical protein
MFITLEEILKLQKPIDPKNAWTKDLLGKSVDYFFLYKENSQPDFGRIEVFIVSVGQTNIRGGKSFEVSLAFPTTVPKLSLVVKDLVVVTAYFPNKKEVLILCKASEFEEIKNLSNVNWVPIDKAPTLRLVSPSPSNETSFKT